MTHISSGTVYIWICQWEYQCCGTPIRVGDTVDLTVCQIDDYAQPWERAVGDRIPLAAEHHVPPDTSYHLRVRVNRLLEARARRSQRSGEDGLSLIRDSGEVCEVDTMQVWDDDWRSAQAGGEPEGWILHATILAELPPGPDGIPSGMDPRPGR